MKIVETIGDIRAFLDDERAAGKVVGFVPTMGALHKGHASLIERARGETQVVVASIFVNPLQFGPSEDFAKYPRTWDDDVAVCEEAGVDVLFHPGVEEMYPTGEPVVRVSAGRLGEPLCGRTRPGHFDGVATVVAKLFNSIGPCRAFFGKKDAQQLVVIKAMAGDLNMPVEVVGCETVREADGLAMSSRNRYLNAKERIAAVAISQALQEGLVALRGGQRTARQVASRMIDALSSPLVRLDYAACVDAETLEEIGTIDRPVLLAVAAWVGKARLIDNVTATPDGAAIQEV